MINHAREMLVKGLEDQKKRFNAREQEREQFFVGLHKDIQPFLKAARKYATTGELDVGALHIPNEDLPGPRSVAKNGGRRKKMSTLTESSANSIGTVEVKREKISAILELDSAKTSLSSTTSSVIEVPKENIKVEDGEMPAPSWIPPKKKVKEIKTERASTRTTRTKGKKAAHANKSRDSDVILESPTIVTINLSDTEGSGPEKAQEETSSARSTRTKTRKQAQALASGTDTDNESTRSTRTKTRNKQEVKIEKEEVEGARSTRTKTIRKENKPEEETKNDETEESQPETRSTRTKTIRKGKVPEVANDTKEDNAVAVETEFVRPTRTKTRKQTENAAQEVPSKENAPSQVALPDQEHKTGSKRTKPESTDDEVVEGQERKKTRSGSPAGDNRTVYEDAQSSLGLPQDKPPLNSTFVTSKPAVKAPNADSTATVGSNPNATVVVDHSKFNIFDKVSTENFFTDDDSNTEVQTPPKKAAVSKSAKEVFSPYEKTTLKKKVEAFEKLHHGGGGEVLVKTGTMTKKSLRNTPSSVNEKAKMFNTPSSRNFFPTSSSTTKISRILGPQLHSSSITNDSSLSASGHRDPRERHKRMQEREQALKKKDAMLMAQAEAKRKQNEEKQLRAQQQRKAIEAEKLKQLQVQKEKEERLHKQREQEREECARKQKEEMERKRLAQKKKLQEIQAKKQAEAEHARNVPIYMVTKPPKLPTEDYYDSDDPDYKKTNPPSWCNEEKLKHTQLSMLAAGEKIKNTLFCRRAQTPDLTQIFETIDPRKLKRSSSILWRKPPRYTMMPDLNETRFSEDAELYESD